jgi:hypothetical protein
MRASVQDTNLSTKGRSAPGNPTRSLERARATEAAKLRAAEGSKRLSSFGITPKILTINDPIVIIEDEAE